MDYKTYLAIIAAGLFVSVTAYGAGGVGDAGVQSYELEEGQQADVQPTISKEGISQLQERLKEAGYYQDGAVDGIWGPETQQAVNDFQRDQGLETTGHLNTETVRAMDLQDEAEFAQFTEEPENGASMQEQPAIQDEEGASPGGEY